MHTCSRSLEKASDRARIVSGDFPTSAMLPLAQRLLRLHIQIGQSTLLVLPSPSRVKITAKPSPQTVTFVTKRRHCSWDILIAGFLQDNRCWPCIATHSLSALLRLRWPAVYRQILSERAAAVPPPFQVSRASDDVRQMSCHLHYARADAVYADKGSTAGLCRDGEPLIRGVWRPAEAAAKSGNNWRTRKHRLTATQMPVAGGGRILQIRSAAHFFRYRSLASSRFRAVGVRLHRTNHDAPDKSTTFYSCCCTVACFFKYTM